MFSNWNLLIILSPYLKYLLSSTAKYKLLSLLRHIFKTFFFLLLFSPFCHDNFPSNEFSTKQEKQNKKKKLQQNWDHFKRNEFDLWVCSVVLKNMNLVKNVGLCECYPFFVLVFLSISISCGFVVEANALHVNCILMQNNRPTPPSSRYNESQRKQGIGIFIVLFSKSMLLEPPAPHPPPISSPLLQEQYSN